MPMIFRLARGDDAAACQAIYAPYVSEAVTSFEYVPPTVAEMRARLEKTLPWLPWLAAETDQGVVGYAYAGPHSERAAYQWSVDVSVYIASAWHRRGIGRALYRPLFAVLAALGYCNIYAGITLPNPGSVALHERLGMTPVGIYQNVGYKHGAWHDVGWWQGALAPPANPPAPPIALAAFPAERLAALLAATPAIPG